MDDAMRWLAENDPDYGQMGEDVYGDVYGISTRKSLNRRRKHEIGFQPDTLERVDALQHDHCPSCRRKRLIGSHTVS